MIVTESLVLNFSPSAGTNTTRLRKGKQTSMEKTTTLSAVAEPKTSVDAGKFAAPVIVDLGSAKKSQIRDLGKGQGKLAERVLGVLDELRSDGTIEGHALPVIVIVKKKAGRKNLLGRFL